MDVNKPISRKIDKYLLSFKKSKNAKMPYGSYAKIAKRFGVSRELVRQRAVKYDIKLGSRYKRKRIKEAKSKNERSISAYCEVEVKI